MTPHELYLYAEVFNLKQKNEQEEKLFVAFMGAWWQRVEMLQQKDLTDVLDLLNGKVKKKMTNEEMLEEVKKLNATFGGTTY